MSFITLIYIFYRKNILKDNLRKKLEISVLIGCPIRISKERFNIMDKINFPTFKNTLFDLYQSRFMALSIAIFF